MKMGVLGTGEVGRRIASKLVELGHEVMVGARRADNETASTWASAHGAHHGDFAQTAAFAEMVFNCTAGAHSVTALEQAGEDNLGDKILVDISNPLDFSQGFPPTLTHCNDSSLGEAIQARFPRLKVVKTLNTVANTLMVDPGQLDQGQHDLFVSGNDDRAKAQVTTLLREQFGWSRIHDLGDITTARGTEAFLLLWTRLYAHLQTPMFNIALVGI